MAVRDDWAPGEVLTSTDLNDTFADKQAQLDDVGVVLINTYSASAASDIKVDNVFTSSYNFYDFVLIGVTSADADIRMVMRSSVPADITGSNYRIQKTVSNTSSTLTEGTTTYFDVATFRTTPQGFVKFSLYNPNIAAVTGFFSYGVDPWSTTYTQRNYVGVHTLTTAYAGVRLYPASGTVTGNLYVYGRRHA